MIIVIIFLLGEFMKIAYKKALGLVASVAFSASAMAANYQSPQSSMSANNNYIGVNAGGGAELGSGIISQLVKADSGNDLYLSGYVGHNFNKYIAMEAGMGYIDNKLFPVYLPYGGVKFMLPFDQFDLYAKLALSSVQISEDGKGLINDGRPIGVAGLGVLGFEYHISSSVSINADTSLWMGNGLATAVSGGLAYHF
jgi:hypothetical protein